MERRPYVSVLISVYNDGKYIASAIQSVLDQTFTDFELILIDDGSTDDTADVIASFSDPRIVSVRQENSGLVPALNRGLEMARGTYLARLDGDDTSRPDRLARQLEFLETNKDRAVVGSWATVHGLDGTQLDQIRPPSDDVELRWLLMWKIIYPHSALMMRTEVLRSVGGWDESFWRTYPHASDYDLVERLSQIGTLAAVPEPLLKWQYDTQDGISVKHRETQKRTNQAIGHRQLERLLGRPVSKEVAANAWRIANDPKRIDPTLADESAALILEAAQTFRASHPGGLAEQTVSEWLKQTAHFVLSEARRDKVNQRVALRVGRALSPTVGMSPNAAKAAVRAVVGSRVGRLLIGK